MQIPILTCIKMTECVTKVLQDTEGFVVYITTPVILSCFMAFFQQSLFSLLKLLHFFHLVYHNTLLHHE